MKVLLYGDYSHVHETLAQGLKVHGVDVKVASSGDGWKNCKRDIDLQSSGKIDSIRLFFKQLYSSEFKNYDVVQAINYNCLNNIVIFEFR